VTEEYGKDLADLLAVYLTRFTDGDLRAYVTLRSRLPGPRANLELAKAFAEACQAQRDWKAMWSLCARWTSIPPGEAPADDPAEFALFCGIRGIGALGASGPQRAREALAHVRPLARDPRWRVREAVAMAIQDTVEGEPAIALRALEDWVGAGAWLEMRAAAAGVAEPGILKERKVALAALDLHMDIVRRFKASKERESADFRTRRQCLGYSVSVVVAAAPEEGFRWLTKLAATMDEDLQWILKENSKKSRLVAKFPGRVERLRAIMRQP